MPGFRPREASGSRSRDETCFIFTRLSSLSQEFQPLRFLSAGACFTKSDQPKNVLFNHIVNPLVFMRKIDAFLTKITRAHPGIREVWRLAYPVKTHVRPGSLWALLAFADEDTFQRLRADVRFRRADVELLVVRDGDEFQEPWGDNPEHGYLSEWEWVKTSDREAQYHGTKWVQDEKLFRTIIELCRASRLWSPEKP